MNKKHLEKARRDIAKVKNIVVEMQSYVQDDQVQIKQNLVSEDKLKVNFELLEAQLNERVTRDLQHLRD